MSKPPSFSMPARGRTNREAAAATPQRQRKPQPDKDYRAGRTQISGWIPAEAKVQLDIWRVRHRKSVQEIMVEALDMWFSANGLHRLSRYVHTKPGE